MPATRRRDRGDEYWVYFRFRGRRVRRRSPIQTRKGAEEFERTLLREFGDDLETGRDPFAGPPPTLAEFAPRWMRETVLVQNRPSTAKKKAELLRVHILPSLGAQRIDHISTASLDHFIADLRRCGLAPKSVNNAVSVLRTCLDTAEKWGLIRHLPRVNWLRVPEQPFRYLTEEEERRLLAATRPGFWRAFILLILHSGVRFSEAAALRWEDIDADGPAPIIRVRRGGSEGVPGPTKTGRGRDLPLTNPVMFELDGLDRHDELIFPKPSGGMMNPSSTTKYLHRICARAGVRPLGWHALRHTFATRAAARGMPLPVLQKLLGHTTIKMTMRYVHIEPSQLAATAGFIESIQPVPWAIVHQVSTNQLVHTDSGVHSPRLLATIGSTNTKADLVGRPLCWSG